jgi:hypothetical protein
MPNEDRSNPSMPCILCNTHIFYMSERTPIEDELRFKKERDCPQEARLALIDPDLGTGCDEGLKLFARYLCLAKLLE